MFRIEVTILTLLCAVASAGAQNVPAQEERPVSPDVTLVPSAPADGGEVTDESPSPALTATMALLLPGAGHAYLGDWAQASGYLGVEAALIGGGLSIDYATDDKALGRHYLVGLGANIHMYSVFDAYRDARNRMGNRGYRYAVDQASYSDLLLAPVTGQAMFEWRTLAVAGGLTAIGVALRIAYHDLNFPDARALNDSERRDNILSHEVDPLTAYGASIPLFGFKYANVGLAEEALFRGVIQQGMKEWWGPTWANVGQATVFSLFHVVNGAQYGLDPAAYAYAWMAGLAFGWLQEETGDLRHGAGAHAWVDFSYSLTEYFYDPTSNPIGFSIEMPMP